MVPHSHLTVLGGSFRVLATILRLANHLVLLMVLFTTEGTALSIIFDIILIFWHHLVIDADIIDKLG